MSGPETKLTIKIKMLGTTADIEDLFRQLNEGQFLSYSQDVTLVVGYYDEAAGIVARDAAEQLLHDHPAVMKTKSTTALTTKRPVVLPPPDEDDGDEDEGEDPPLLRAIAQAGPRFDTLPLHERIVRLLRVAPHSVADLVSALHDPESATPNPTAGNVRVALNELFDGGSVDQHIGGGLWCLTEQGRAEAVGV